MQKRSRLTRQLIVKDFSDLNDLKGSNVATYDLMGRRVTDLKPGTIYIRNGKKFMFNK